MSQNGRRGRNPVLPHGELSSESRSPNTGQSENTSARGPRSPRRTLTIPINSPDLLPSEILNAEVIDMPYVERYLMEVVRANPVSTKVGKVLMDWIDLKQILNNREASVLVSDGTLDEIKADMETLIQNHPELLAVTQELPPPTPEYGDGMELESEVPEYDGGNLPYNIRQAEPEEDDEDDDVYRGDDL